MEHVQVNDEWLYKYMPIVDKAIIRELEKTIDYEYPFSGKFERKMKRLMRKEAHPWKTVFYRQSKPAAVFLLCMIGAIFLLSMSVQAYRIEFFQTVKTIWEDSVLYSYFVDVDQENFQCNEPQYIPMGYQETNRVLSDIFFSITYKNGDGELIVWDQMPVMDGGSLVVDSEYDTQSVIEINGDNAIISLYSDGFAGVYYEHGAYVYQLTAENLSTEELCAMLASIK